ncbi:hypothetical protein GCM10018955_15800 [Planomonospora venezuelensis]
MSPRHSPREPSPPQLLGILRRDPGPVLGERAVRRAGVRLLAGLEPAGEQLGDPLFQDRDPGVALAQRGRGALQRLVHALRVVADQAHRELEGHEVHGTEVPGVGQGERGDVGRELGQLAALPHGDQHHAGEDGESGEGEYDQHTTNRATTPGA